jgi:hypothetical protein
MPPHNDPGTFEIGPDGVVYDGPPGDLETLLSSKPILSDPFEVSHGGETVKARFRELSNSQKQSIQAFAIQWFEDKRREQEKDGAGEWRDAESDRYVMIGEERHLRMLQAAMIQPDSFAPACSLGWLRKRMGTQLETMLGNRYAAFEASIDPVNVGEEEIEAVLQDVRDNYPFDYLLTQYDVVLLVRSLQYSVSLHSKSATDKSSGLVSGEVQH